MWKNKFIFFPHSCELYSKTGCALEVRRPLPEPADSPPQAQKWPSLTSDHREKLLSASATLSVSGMWEAVFQATACETTEQSFSSYGVIYNIPSV